MTNVMRLPVYAAMLLAAIAIGSTANSLTQEPQGAPAVESSAAQPQVKLMVMLTRREDLSREQFRTYFLDEHMPFVRAIPNVDGYVVNFADTDDTDAPFDAISEFWFADVAAFEEAMASPETAATLEDATNFIVASGPQMMVVYEHVERAPPR